MASILQDIQAFESEIKSVVDKFFSKNNELILLGNATLILNAIQNFALAFSPVEALFPQYAIAFAVINASTVGLKDVVQIEQQALQNS